MGKYLSLSAQMLLMVLVCSLSLLATGQQPDDEWIDPYDMLNYDASTKTMRKPAEPANYPNVPTKRKEYTQEDQAERTAERAACNRQVEELRKKITNLSQKPTCNPVFKRFLKRLLKEIHRVGVPSDSGDVLYDAKVRLSKQAMMDIQTLLEGEDSWRTGALDNVISQILVDLKPHDKEAWKWRFEDTFGVELYTVLMIGLGVLVLMTIICTELWSAVSWFLQIRRLFAVSFVVSIVWNWVYLYQVAFAERQNNLVKLDGFNEKCTGLKGIDWRDNLRDWARSTWTLQDDPCKKYHEYLLIPPYLLVPPSKAISVTITTFITEPLKHLGQGIGEFLRALLKDLPVTLQIPVLLTIVLAVVVCIYTSVQAAFVHGITAPFRRPRRDPPPPQLEQPQRHVQEIEDFDHLAGGDAPQPALRAPTDDVRTHRNQVRQRRPDRPRQDAPRNVPVVTLRTADHLYSGDETDTILREAELDNSAESDSEQQQQEDELAEATANSVAANTAQSKTKPSEPDSSQSKPLKASEKPPEDEPSGDRAVSRSEAAERQPPQTDVQDLAASAEDIYSDSIETVGVPVQESSPVSAE